MNISVNIINNINVLELVSLFALSIFISIFISISIIISVNIRIDISFSITLSELVLVFVLNKWDFSRISVYADINAMNRRIINKLELVLLVIRINH